MKQSNTLPDPGSVFMLSAAAAPLRFSFTYKVRSAVITRSVRNDASCQCSCFLSFGLFGWGHKVPEFWPADLVQNQLDQVTLSVFILGVKLIWSFRMFFDPQQVDVSMHTTRFFHMKQRLISVKLPNTMLLSYLHYAGIYRFLQNTAGRRSHLLTIVHTSQKILCCCCRTLVRQGKITEDKHLFSPFRLKMSL